MSVFRELLFALLALFSLGSFFFVIDPEVLTDISAIPELRFYLAGMLFVSVIYLDWYFWHLITAPAKRYLANKGTSQAFNYPWVGSSWFSRFGYLCLLISCISLIQLQSRFAEMLGIVWCSVFLVGLGFAYRLRQWILAALQLRDAVRLLDVALPAQRQQPSSNG